ncbi:MAG: DUF6498-containing protein [Bacteroidota bacterium]
MTFSDFLLKRVNANIKKNFRSLLVILVIDLIPLFAVLYKGWSVVDAVYLYFMETLLLAGFAMLKMRRARYNLALQKVSKAVGAEKLGLYQQAKQVKIPGSNLLRRGFKFVFILTFLLISIPVALVELGLLNAISGIQYFKTHLSGDLILGLDIFWWILILMFAEHFYYYRRRFVKNEEYKNTGVLNEGLNITIRIVIQQVVMIFGLLLAMSTTASEFVAIVLILFKLFTDLVSYLYNRYWGGLANKVEVGQSKVSPQALDV